MSTVKTIIDKEVVLSYLKNNFASSTSDLLFINGGEMSQAFSFNADDESYVIRVNTNPRSFYKDEYAFKHFSCTEIPIPEILKIGELDDGYYFAISKKAEGVHISKLSNNEYKETLSNILVVMDRIHEIDVKSCPLFGKWNQDGTSKYNTWKEFILSVNDFDNKEKLFNTSFLEKDVWNEVFDKIKLLTEFCPEEKYLVHGDYGSDNVISDGKKVTGVLDWAESMYGDYLYDISWLTFWQQDLNKVREIEDYYKSKNILDFKERLLCYKLRIGLGSLSFYAYSNQKDKYDSIKSRTLNLLSN